MSRKTNWARIDSNLPRNPKMADLDAEAKWLYVASILQAKHDRTDGFVRAPVVCVAEDVSADFAEVLISRGLWHRAGHKCDECAQPERGRGWVVIHDFLQWQESQEAITSRSDALSTAGRRGADKRWAKANPKANPMARAKGGPMANPNGVASGQVIADSDSDIDTSGHALLSDADCDAITSLTGGGPAHARKTFEFILGKIPEPPRNPLAYVLQSIRNEPEPYRWRRSNPRRGEWCIVPGHEGEWADACRSCALDAKMLRVDDGARILDEPDPEPDWTEDI